MKIVQLIYSLASGGAERLVVDLCNEMVKKHDVTLITIDDLCSFNNDFYLGELSPEVRLINLKRKGDCVLSLITIFNIIRKLKPDIVNAHLNTNLYLLAPSLTSKRIKFFHTLHNTTEKTCRFPLEKALNRFFYRKGFIKPITISPQSKMSFLNYFKFDNSVLIMNGRKKLSPTEKYVKIKDEINYLRIHPDDTVFIHIGRFNACKNQRMLINVFNKLLKEGRHLILLIIGDYFDTEQAKNLHCDVERGIYFLGPKTDVADYLYCSDAFCLSSIREGMPITLIEAMSCGVIPISTPVGGVIDVIDGGKYGFLSNNFDEEDYLQTIKRYLRNKNAISAETLTNHFNNEYSIEKCSSKYLELYS